jgi:hypothetical protein
MNIFKNNLPFVASRMHQCIDTHPFILFNSIIFVKEEDHLMGSICSKVATDNLYGELFSDFHCVFIGLKER